MSKHSGVGNEALASALLGKSVPPRLMQEVGSALLSWIMLMDQWNQKTDLTAAKSPEQFVDLAVADALVLAEAIESAVTVVDVGSGAGAPGIPLAILRPDLSVTLVEPLRKRVAFLRTVIGTLGLPVTVAPQRGEEFAREGGLAHTAISRATLEPEAWLALGERLVVPAGRVGVLLARHEPPTALGQMRRQDCYEYRWPLTQVERRLCWYGRENQRAT